MADEVITPKRSRRVDSGTWPLYVMQLVALLISAAIQVVQWKVPPSVGHASPGWYDTFFLVSQPLGAFIVLVALFLIRPIVPSLQLERIGCIINFFVGTIYVAAVIVTNSGPPAAGATWLIAGFALYSLYRVNEINKAFGLDMLRPLRRSHGE